MGQRSSLFDTPLVALAAALSASPWIASPKCCNRAAVGHVEHPVGYLLYSSGSLIHFVISSHPIHMLFQLQAKSLEVATAHSGFESFVEGKKSNFKVGDFFHQEHHRNFECNYGDPKVPIDRWRQRLVINASGINM